MGGVPTGAGTAPDTAGAATDPQAAEPTLKNARRRLAAMQVEFDEAARAEEYKRKGHALWANIGQLSGRPAQVELADLFDSEGGLDPAN